MGAPGCTQTCGLLLLDVEDAGTHAIATTEMSVRVSCTVPAFPDGHGQHSFTLPPEAHAHTRRDTQAHTCQVCTHDINPCYTHHADTLQRRVSTHTSHTHATHTTSHTSHTPHGHTPDTELTQCHIQTHRTRTLSTFSVTQENKVSVSHLCPMQSHM